MLSCCHNIWLVCRWDFWARNSQTLLIPIWCCKCDYAKQFPVVKYSIPDYSRWFQCYSLTNFCFKKIFVNFLWLIMCIGVQYTFWCIFYSPWCNKSVRRTYSFYLLLFLLIWMFVFVISIFWMFASYYRSHENLMYRIFLTVIYASYACLYNTYIFTWCICYKVAKFWHWIQFLHCIITPFWEFFNCFCSYVMFCCLSVFVQLFL